MKFHVIKKDRITELVYKILFFSKELVQDKFTGHFVEQYNQHHHKNGEVLTLGSVAQEKIELWVLSLLYNSRVGQNNEKELLKILKKELVKTTKRSTPY